jgi:hypothetical protein
MVWNDKCSGNVGDLYPEDGGLKAIGYQEAMKIFGRELK